MPKLPKSAKKQENRNFFISFNYENRKKKLIFFTSKCSVLTIELWAYKRNSKTWTYNLLPIYERWTRYHL